MGGARSPRAPGPGGWAAGRAGRGRGGVAAAAPRAQAGPAYAAAPGARAASRARRARARSGTVPGFRHMRRLPATTYCLSGPACREDGAGSRRACAAGFAAPPMLPAIASPKAWHYRNHMRFSVNREGQAGLTARGSRRVLPLRTCPIAEERINDTLAVLADTPLSPPQALIRSSAATGPVLMQPTPSGEARRRLKRA